MVIAIRSVDPAVNIYQVRPATMSHQSISLDLQVKDGLSALPRGLSLQVNELLSQSGWNLNALHRPAAVHMCLTAANAQSVPKLLQGAQQLE